MTAAIRLAFRIRERFSRAATPLERRCYDLAPVRLPVSVAVVNERVVVLECDPADRPALLALGAVVGVAVLLLMGRNS